MGSLAHARASTLALVGRVEPPAKLWVHEHLSVERSSIEGHGLFATRDLSAGTIVVQLAGRLVTSDELTALIAESDADPDAPYVDTFTVYEDAHLVLPPGTVAHYGNHSCDPNLWLAGPYGIATRRDVAAGEELTIDYATISGADGLLMTCGCASSQCRGEITSDWRRPELQTRYRGHWAPALEDRIRSGGRDVPS
jgi:hypothetical protein